MATVEGEEVNFLLPSPPPSMNSIYNVLFGLKRVELKPQVRAYKTTMKMYVPSWNVDAMDKVGVRLEVAQNWFFKNGKYKKQDVQNMAKVLVDLIAEKMGFDDSQVWRMELDKHHSEFDNKVRVKLWKIKETPNAPDIQNGVGSK